MRNLNTGKNLLHWLANVDEDGIAWLHLQTDGKSVNVLTHAVMAELGSLVDQLEASEDLTGVAMLSGKPGGFVYGADIHEFETLKTAGNVANHSRRWFNASEPLGQFCGSHHLILGCAPGHDVVPTHAVINMRAAHVDLIDANGSAELLVYCCRFLHGLQRGRSLASIWLPAVALCNLSM